MGPRKVGPPVLRNNTYKKYIDGRGWGLFASQDLPVNAPIVVIPRPLLASLDIPRLKDTCYSCFGYSRIKTSSADVDLESDHRSLLTCTGCRVVKYCNQQCQRASWLTTHKHECQLFARLYPKVLPSNVRAVVQMLLLRETSKASQVEWNNFLGLQSHVEKWKSHNDETWDNITLMSKAAKEYSGTDVDRVVVQDIFCKLMINSFSLSSPSQYSIGFVLHPLLALTNHSCNYNAAVEFTWNGPGTNPLLLYAARPIAKDEEVLISYIDPGDNLTARRKALEDRYFFTCNCDRCSKEDDELQRK